MQSHIEVVEINNSKQIVLSRTETATEREARRIAQMKAGQCVIHVVHADGHREKL